MIRLNQVIHSEWCVPGDFNAILNYEDKFQGMAITNYEIQDFVNCLQHNDIMELKSCGHFYSWNNECHGDAS